MAVSADKHPTSAAVDRLTHRGERVVDVVGRAPPDVDSAVRRFANAGAADLVHNASAAHEVEEDGEGRGIPAT